MAKRTPESKQDTPGQADQADQAAPKTSDQAAPATDGQATPATPAKDGQAAPVAAVRVPVTTIYETVEMTAEQVEQQNAAYVAMGLPVRVINVGLFSAKMELQADGTYKRTAIRRAKTNGPEAGNDSE